MWLTTSCSFLWVIWKLHEIKYFFPFISDMLKAGALAIVLIASVLFYNPASNNLWTPYELTLPSYEFLKKKMNLFNLKPWPWCSIDWHCFYSLLNWCVHLWYFQFSFNRGIKSISLSFSLSLSMWKLREITSIVVNWFWMKSNLDKLFFNHRNN